MSAASARRTLILNADYAPLSTWPLSLLPAQDALKAVVKGTVTQVEDWPGEFYRSPSVSLAVPKTIALRQYQPIHTKPKFCRRNIYLRDRFSCCYCGVEFPTADLTFDHVVPREAGGRTEWENILTCCVPCNVRKRNLMPQWSAKKGHPLRPLKQPRQPTTVELLRAGLELLDNETKETWSQFLYWNVELEA